MTNFSNPITNFFNKPTGGIIGKTRQPVGATDFPENLFNLQNKKERKMLKSNDFGNDSDDQNEGTAETLRKEHSREPLTKVVPGSTSKKVVR